MSKINSLGPDTDYNNGAIQMSSQGYLDLMKVNGGQNLYWTTDINVELPIKMQSTGIGSQIKPDTITNYMKKTVAQRGDAPAMFVQRGKKEYVWTWNQYYHDTMAFAKGLLKLGIEERKAVNIMGFNSPEWAIAYHGSIFHNNVVSGVYITNGPAACKYQA